MTKMLFHSNAPWAPTGYGNQCALFAPRLAEHFDLRISTFYGLEGSPQTWNGVTVLPGVGGTYGNETLPVHAKRFFGGPRGGVIFTLMDVWVLDPKMAEQMDMVCWTPMDHTPAPPRVVNFFRESQAIPIAMSRFGVEQLAEFDPFYCPHAVDTNVFRPIDRAEARDKFAIGQDDFVILQVAANKGNPSRKCFPTVLEAFAEFQREHEEAKLFLYTDADGRWSQGVNLAPLISELKIPPESVVHMDPYVIHLHPMAAEVMAHLYSAADVLVNPSAGEGFGIPILEAQSCGTPAIVTDFSAMPEVCGSGWSIGGTRRWTAQDAWQVTPHVEDLYGALEACYASTPEVRAEFSERARSHALSYDIQRVLEEHMLPVLEAAQDRLQARQPVFVAGQASRNGYLRVGDVDLVIDDHPDGGVKDVVAVELEAFKLDEIPVEPGDVILDIGAHVGVVSIYLAKKHPDAIIYAFEPLPENFERLQRNIEANEVTNVAAFPLAVTADGRDLDLIADPTSNSGGATAFTESAKGETVRVPSIAIDRLFTDYDIDRCRLLKIDCEGAEYEILENGILDRVDYVTGEFHVNQQLADAGRDPKVLITRLVDTLGEDHVRAMICKIERLIMHVGWLVDDPNYTGGAEMTMFELRAAAPDGVHIIDCPPGDIQPDLDLYVVGNCWLYKPADKPDGTIIRIIHDVRGPGPIDSDNRIFYSPLQRERVGLPGWLCPAPLDRKRFHPNGHDRHGAVHVGTFGNQGKGQRQLVEWAQQHGGLAVYGHGPFLPEGPGIDYKGPIQPEDIPGVLQHAEWFVHLPTAVESYGRGVVEAWACDCRLIVNQNVGALYWLRENPDLIDDATDRFWELALNA